MASLFVFIRLMIKNFCKKLYIASGSIETSKIILNSFKNISKIVLKEVTLEGSLWFS